MFQKKVLILLVIPMLFLTVYAQTFGKEQKTELKSPWVEPGRLAVNLWFPKVAANSEETVPKITAKSAYFVDLNNGEILYQKNPQERLPIASLSKIMTAIVTLESKNWNDKVKISDWAASMEPDSMLLKSGETLTVEELMSGLFLVSANDASEALAESLTGNRDDFINLMNKKAAQLGMKDTFFINPSGLQEDEKKQYSTAYDVALMSRYAIKKFPHLVDISSSPHIFLPSSENHQDYDLYSGINLLTTHPGVLGFKTGYTPEAGLTLVTLAEKEGREVLGVLLNSESRREDARTLLDYSFQKLGTSE